MRDSDYDYERILSFWNKLRARVEKAGLPASALPDIVKALQTKMPEPTEREQRVIDSLMSWREWAGGPLTQDGHAHYVALNGSIPYEYPTGH